MLFSNGDSFLEVLSQGVEVALERFKVWIELVNQLLCVISNCSTGGAFDLDRHVIEDARDIWALRLIDELILDLVDGVNHFCGSLMLLHWVFGDNFIIFE